MGAARPDPADYMHEVARTASAVAYKAHVVAELGLARGIVVVDVGCGPGTDLPTMAETIGPTGLAVGVDLDPTMLGRAARRESANTALVAGDAHRLPFRSATVERIRTDRALQHMADPRLVLSDFRRVLRPAGLAVIAEPDWGTLVIDAARSDASDAFVQYTCREVVRNAVIGRKVARLGAEAGFVVDDVVAFPTVVREFESADKVFGLTRNALAAAEAGYLDIDEARRWVGDLEAGPVLVAVTLFVTTLRKPVDART